MAEVCLRRGGGGGGGGGGGEGGNSDEVVRCFGKSIHSATQHNLFANHIINK